VPIDQPRTASQPATRHGRSHAGRGQAVAELAVTAPILLIVLLGIAQLGTILATQIGIANAVREAAREAAAIATTSDGAASTNGAWTSERLRLDLLPGVPSYDASRLVVSTSSPDTVCYSPATDASGATGVVVRVDARYRHALWLPLVSGILDGIDGSADGSLGVDASEQMWVEGASSPSLSGTVCVP
jgi:Flp pilus assembly protein TadG